MHTAHVAYTVYASQIALGVGREAFGLFCANQSADEFLLLEKACGVAQYETRLYI